MELSVPSTRSFKNSILSERPCIFIFLGVKCNVESLKYIKTLICYTEFLPCIIWKSISLFLGNPVQTWNTLEIPLKHKQNTLKTPLKEFCERSLKFLAALSSVWSGIMANNTYFHTPVSWVVAVNSTPHCLSSYWPWKTSLVDRLSAHSCLVMLLDILFHS